MNASTTRYGSPWSPPRAAGALLRAKAAAVGAQLSPVDDVALVAAAIGADAWMLAVGASSLSTPAAAGASALRALVAVLHRAAGSPLEPLPSPWESPCSTAMVVHVDAYAAYAHRELGATDAPAALAAAADDLGHAGPSGRLAELSELLSICADHVAVHPPTHS